MGSLNQQIIQTGEPINFGLVIFAPFSSVPGSASIFYLQPLLTGRTLASAGIIIGSELFLFLAQHFFGLEEIPIYCPEKNGENPIVRMPVPELQELLGTLAKYCLPNDKTDRVENPLPHGYPYTLPERTTSIGGFLTTQTPEAPLVVSLAVYGDYSTKPFSPLLFFTIPIFTLPGIRGALPLLILSTLGTILVRSVTPPETTGSKPLKANPQISKPFRFSANDLFILFNRFGKNFSSQ